MTQCLLADKGASLKTVLVVGVLKIEGCTRQKPELIYKKLCIYLYTLKLEISLHLYQYICPNVSSAMQNIF